MPIAIILVAMVTLLGGWYSSERMTQQNEAKLTSEAQAIAANMLSYQRYINDYVKYKDPAGDVPNYHHFQTFNGDAQDFIAQADAAGRAPGTMTWFKGPMPGVSAQINAGRLVLHYAPTSSANASQRGVQAELLRMTRGSYGVGKTVATPTP